MLSVQIAYSTDQVWRPCAVALGNFDGIHRGHRQVLQPILSLADGSEKIYATVVTFKPHPREFFTGQRRLMLTPLPEKIQRLEALGIEQLVLLPFDRQLAALTPQEFVEIILVNQLQTRQVSVGQDFCFGRDRRGTTADLLRLSAPFGIKVHIAALQTDGETESLRISSSAIRQALETGDVSLANSLLGRAYTLSGTVIPGQQRGRTLGFPTANLQLPPDKLLPRLGVYCGHVFFGQAASGTNPPIGILNVGCRPTVDGAGITAEIHLLNWQGDLYGQTLTMTLEAFLRTEQKFTSLAALQAQIAQDCQKAQVIMSAKVPTESKLGNTNP
ncbi:MAG: bifunctional riboflavin kinase/FAD synthetase [Chloroflexaceae bacterium]|nr:bifunctional riboflavin kinase/FAD synthetase [Chloroflexaceae bacterium]